MTVIAWDGRTLAADKMAVTGITKGSVKKIFYHGGELLGVTGNLSIGMEVMRWYTDGADPGKFPASNRNLNEGSSLIRIDKDCKVWKYESSPIPFRVEGDRCAFGSGDEAALVAMEMGADARRAVELASMFNTTCGGGCDAIDWPLK
jgi:hypothetical protein